MVTTNIQVAGLDSYQPALDYKKSGRVAVLSGKNFAWDASGVYAAYASRLVDSNVSIGLAPTIAQTLDLEDLVHVAMENKIWQLNPTSEESPLGNWELVTTLAPLVNADFDVIPYDYRKWSTAYLGKKRYACAYNFGVHRVTPGEPPTYFRLNQGNTVGFPDDSDPVIAIAETNGRLCFMTSTTFYWSAANAPENLVPAVGGPGFQVIGEKIAGTPVAMMPTSIGVIIWTTTGALVCEFVGGSTVFRYWTLVTEALPISSFSITRMSDDTYAVLTRLGLFQVVNMGQPQIMTGIFNEFLREYLRTRIAEKGHIWYSVNDNRLYVSFRSGRSAFNETYALDLAVDKWGIFSEQHLGFFNYGVGRGQLSYVNTRGVASYLLSSIDIRKSKENPLNPGTFTGLGSEIVIGWLRAEDLLGHADVTQESVEILVSRSTPFNTVSVTTVDEGFVTSPGADIFDEGMVNSAGGVYVASDYVDDDYVLDTNPEAIIYVDEGLVSEQDEVINYRLQLITDIFRPELGQDTEEMNLYPTLVRQDQHSDLWVGCVPAIYHRMRFIATEPNEFFRVNTIDFTVTYTGNLS
ncbi:hypothetical protein Bpfe_031142 [Biomphalaria pfeifferi]|uniref:Uncharacterized protein n=1 Tax=Biomphalaria pfeifferi TaxID=112525 RepID=A0AAD8ARA4_BIOPF|nr:hypothetical protein Bpfe_031142 [Biomphalaria pfeifferi]